MLNRFVRGVGFALRSGAAPIVVGARLAARRREEAPVGRENEMIAAQLTVQVRSAKPDPDYVHPYTGDHYRTRQLQSMVRIRNFALN